MKAIRYTGLILFLFSFFLFLGLFFMSSYTLSEDNYKKIVKAEHRELLDENFENIIGESYALSVPFVIDINGAIEEVNAQMRAEQKWDKV
ncbi:MAG: hypothetical protein RJQ14_12055, partial [Marinoscillum sp.]